MKKLFDKNEVTFAVILIVVYVVGSGVMQGISESIGIAFLAEMVFHIVMAAVLLGFLRRNGLMQHVGLCRSGVPAAKMWFYLPLVLCAAFPLCFGVGFTEPGAAMLCRTVSMLFVGFLEELIFRGFLFRGICRSSVRRGIIISAITFGIGHIVNLLNGYTGLDAIMQTVFAIGCGFLLVFIFHKTGSLLACIGFHSLNNMLTGFQTGAILNDAVGETNALVIEVIIRIVIIGVYLVYILKAIPDRTTE